MKEEEIRPAALFDQYLALAEKDIATFFSGAHLHHIPCPACGSDHKTSGFKKKGFEYHECAVCNTLYVNPRPDQDAFSRFYRDSPSVRFWATHFYKETEQARNELIIKPKAKLVSQIIRKYTSADHPKPVVLDIGAGYGGFCVALKTTLKKPYVIIGIEPASSLQAVCREKNIEVIPKFLEEVQPSDFEGRMIIAATSFELLEHLHNPGTFIGHCHDLLGKGGILILTTLNWKGFDLQMLGERSRSLNPPHHINLFTPRSLSLLMEKKGFEILEMTTPGKLDVDIVSKQLQDVQCSFIRDLLAESNDQIREGLQKIIQETRMSSHMMIVARKKERC